MTDIPRSFTHRTTDSSFFDERHERLLFNTRSMWTYSFVFTVVTWSCTRRTTHFVVFHERHGRLTRRRTVRVSVIDRFVEQPLAFYAPDDGLCRICNERRERLWINTRSRRTYSFVFTVVTRLCTRGTTHFVVFHERHGRLMRRRSLRARVFRRPHGFNTTVDATDDRLYRFLTHDHDRSFVLGQYGRA